jgi:hypothetical protein
MRIKTVHSGYDTILLLCMEINEMFTFLTHKNWHRNGNQGPQTKVRKHFVSVAVLV